MELNAHRAQQPIAAASRPTPPRPRPKGRHRLPTETVTQIHRERIVHATAPVHELIFEQIVAASAGLQTPSAGRSAPGRARSRSSDSS